MQKPRYQRIKANYSAIVATLALAIAVGTSGAMATGVFVTSKQIKNGTILSQDIKNNQVKSADIKNESVGTPDIGAGAVDSTDIGNGQVSTADIGTGQVNSAAIGNGEVRAADLTLPAPKQLNSPAAQGAVTNQFTKLADVGTYTKETAESVLQAEWTGAVGPGSGTNCVFQLRVNGQPSEHGGGEVFALDVPVNVSTVGIFPGLGAGPVTVEVWAKYSATATSSPTCILGPTNPGITNTFIVSEAVQ